MEKVERGLMPMEEFEKMIADRKQQLIDDLNNGIVHLSTYQAVSQFKSVARAIRRGHVSMDGVIYPRRPFNNRAGNRVLNTRKKIIYGELKQREAA